MLAVRAEHQMARTRAGFLLGVAPVGRAEQPAAAVRRVAVRVQLVGAEILREQIVAVRREHGGVNVRVVLTPLHRTAAFVMHREHRRADLAVGLQREHREAAARIGRHRVVRGQQILAVRRQAQIARIIAVRGDLVEKRQLAARGVETKRADAAALRGRAVVAGHFVDRVDEAAVAAHHEIRRIDRLRDRHARRFARLRVEAIDVHAFALAGRCRCRPACHRRRRRGPGRNLAQTHAKQQSRP